MAWREQTRPSRREVRAEVGKPIHLRKSVSHVAQKHGDVIVGIRTRIAARARTEQHGTFEPIAVDFVAAARKRPRVGPLGALLAISYI